MEGGEAGADYCYVLGAEAGEGAADKEGLGGGFGGEDAELDYGDAGVRVDEFHRDEDAVVPG